MTSLQNNGKILTSAKPNKICHSKDIDDSYPKMCFLLNLSHCVKSYGHFCKTGALFTMPAYQIWSCQVTRDANFEIFYFILILHLILGKVTKFPVEQLSTSEVISQKPHKTPPPPPSHVPLGLNPEIDIAKSLKNIDQFTYRCHLSPFYFWFDLLLEFISVPFLRTKMFFMSRFSLYKRS